MSGLRELVSRFKMPFGRAREDAEMDEELRFHLDMAIERNVARGLAPDEARRQALIAMGGLERHRESMRDGRRIGVVEDGWRDLRYAARSLVRRPGYAAVIVLTLALGIGASVAVATVSRVLFREPIPFPEADRLVGIDLTYPRASGRNPTWSDFQQWEEQASGVISLGGYGPWTRTLGDGARTVYARGYPVTGGFFPVLGIPPLLGRVLTRDDARPNSPPVAVLSERLWRQEFGSDPVALGRQVTIDGAEHTVVGVVDSRFEFPAGADLWLPARAPASGAEYYPTVFGRLARGTTAEQAQSALTAIQGGLDADRPVDQRATGIELTHVVGRWADDAYLATSLLSGAVLLLLAIGIINAAGLMIARGVERGREIAIRASLGASRGRIVRLLLAESMLLSIAAGVVGTAVAYGVIQVLRQGPAEQFARDNLLGWNRIGVDLETLLYALGLSLLAGLAFGLAPAIGAVRGRVVRRIQRGAARATTSKREGRSVKAFLAAEVALTLTLLLSAGLLARSLWSIAHLDPGVRTDGVLTMRWMLPPEGYEEQPEAVIRFQDALLEQGRSTFGVERVALTSDLPMSQMGFGAIRQYDVAGDRAAAGQSRADWRSIDESYLGLVEVPVVAGRSFGPADAAGSPPVAIVSEALARRHWEDPSDALGEELSIDEERRTIVGVVGNVLSRSRTAEATLYVPYRQAPQREGVLVARIRGDAPEAGERLRQAIWSIDSAAGLDQPRTLEHLMRESFANDRTLTMLVGFFAATALVISVMSLFALVSHSVARRRREIGIRLALGALPRRIVRGVMATGMRWVAVGVVVGIGLSAAVGRVLGSFLFGIRPTDPVVFVVVPLGMLCLAAVAAFIPARGAAIVDPTVTLKAD